MKVDISRKEDTHGLLFKKKVYVVTLNVQLTEEEKKAIELANIRNHVLVERPPRAGVKDSAGAEDVFHLYVRHILNGKPDVYEFSDLGQAMEYQEALPDALRALKGIIERTT